MPSRTQTIAKAGFLILLLPLAVSLLFIARHQYITNKLQETITIPLEEVARQQGFQFTSLIEQNKIIMASIAREFRQEDIGNITEEQLLLIQKTSKFDFLRLISVDGNVLIGSDTQANLADRDYFQRALKGEMTVSEALTSRLNMYKVFTIATPIMQNGRVKAILSAGFKLDQLNNIFAESFSKKGYSCVVDKKGTIVYENQPPHYFPPSHNIISSLKEVDFTLETSYGFVVNSIVAEEKCKAEYIYNTEHYTMLIIPLDINSWSLIYVIPYDVISKNASDITFMSLITGLVITALFVIAIYLAARQYKKQQQEMYDIAFVDPLTKAPTPSRFTFDSADLLAAKRDKTFGIVKFDIDNFKMINKIHGIEAGNSLLIKITRILHDKLPKDRGTYARISADWFMYLVHGSTAEEIDTYIADIDAEIKTQTFNTVDHNIGTYAGVYIFNPGKMENVLESAMENVNFAHNKAKKLRTAVYHYDKEEEQQAVFNAELTTKMHAALAAEEFVIYLQPKYSINGSKMMGAEALVRWNKDGKQLLPPCSFIPLFEANGFILPLDWYVYDKACAGIAKWMQDGKKPVVVSVNFSRDHLKTNFFVDKLCNIADKHKVPHNLLEVELLESTIFENEKILVNVIHEIHQAGFTLSMDDFGTGYSSLGLLKNLPVDVIKLDKQFFENWSDPHRANALLTNIFRLARDLGIKTVAEGVERQDVVDMLRHFGCDMAQGHYYAKPMPWNDMKLEGE